MPAPGKPEFKATSRSRLSLADDDARRSHPQSFLDQGPQRDLARAFQRGLAALHRNPVSAGQVEFEHLLAGDDSFTSRNGTGQRVEHGRFAGLGRAGDQDVRTAGNGGIEEAGRWRGQRALGDETSQIARALNELANVDRREGAGDKPSNVVANATGDTC